MSTYQDVLDRIAAVRERSCKEYEVLAAMTNRTIVEVEADLTAPNPCFFEGDELDAYLEAAERQYWDTHEICYDDEDKPYIKEQP